MVTTVTMIFLSMSIIKNNLTQQNKTANNNNIQHHIDLVLQINPSHNIKLTKMSE
jgi:hypothetical protein